MRFLAALLIVLFMSGSAFCEDGVQKDPVDMLVNAYRYRYMCWQPDIADNKAMPFEIIQESGIELIASNTTDGYTYELYAIPESEDCIAIAREGDSIHNVQYINADSSHDYFENGILTDEVYAYFYCPNPNSGWRWDGTFLSYFMDGSCVMFVYATPQSTEPRSKIYNNEDTYVILDYIPEYMSTDPYKVERSESE